MDRDISGRLLCGEIDAAIEMQTNFVEQCIPISGCHVVHSVRHVVKGNLYSQQEIQNK